MMNVEVVVAHSERATLRVGDMFSPPSHFGHPEHLGDVIAGYRTDIDRELIRAWLSLRCLSNTRWLIEHGFGPADKLPEIAVL